MSGAAPIGGIFPAVLTPVDEALEPDAPRAAAYYRDLLAAGFDGLNVMGTTGEAMSLGLHQRLAFMEALVAHGVPPARMMVGTGAASLDDAARLSRQAFALGFAAALVMPPFFLRDAGGDDVVRFFDRLFARAEPPPRSVLLYHFPRVSGIAFTLELVERLTAEFPEPIAGMKDSANDRELQRAVLAARPQLRVFPSSESELPQARAAGAAGCISATIALSPQEARAAFYEGDARSARRVACRRAAFDGVPLVAAMREMVAAQRGDPAWQRNVVPQRALEMQELLVLRAAFSRCV